MYINIYNNTHSLNNWAVLKRRLTHFYWIAAWAAFSALSSAWATRASALSPGTSGIDFKRPLRHRKEWPLRSTATRGVFFACSREGFWWSTVLRFNHQLFTRQALRWWVRAVQRKGSPEVLVMQTFSSIINSKILVSPLREFNCSILLSSIAFFHVRVCVYVSSHSRQHLNNLERCLCWVWFFSGPYHDRPKASQHEHLGKSSVHPIADLLPTRLLHSADSAAIYCPVSPSETLSPLTAPPEGKNT